MVGFQISQHAATISSSVQQNTVVILEGVPMVQTVKNLPAMQKMQVPSLGWEDPLEEDMATHSHTSILAGKISWTEEPDGLQSIRFQRVGHD